MLTTLAVPYADSHAAGLSWWLGDGPDHLGELVLHADHGTLALRLLGASHQAVARLGDVELPEVVACGPVPAELPRSAVRDLDGGIYRFRSSTSSYSSGDLARLARDLRARWSTDHGAVVGVFPGSPDALTVLAGAARRRGWSWRTWHVYPSAGEVVRTASSLVRR